MGERFLPDTVSLGFYRAACYSAGGHLGDRDGIVVLMSPPTVRILPLYSADCG